MSKGFDVIVIGGGHAGCEAAAAAARLGARTALVTHRFATIGEMSCNPAIGGLGKGHLVREIDALDGLMGRVADQAGIQFRVLNRSKGPAVQGPRAQADRKLYRQAMQAAIQATPGLEVIEAAVEDLIVDQGRVTGIVTADGRRLSAGAVVLTTGTFLNGLIHIGETKIPAGRMGEAPALGLSTRLYGLGFRMGRLKTGTPPRLDGRTIRWDGLQVQHGDDPPRPFSFLTERIATPQVACHITHTTDGDPRHHRGQSRSRADVFRRHRDRSARAIVRRSKTRWFASRSATATRSSSSRKASTTTPSIPTASRPRCPKTCSTPSSRPSRVSNRRGASGPATPSNTTMSTRAS